MKKIFALDVDGVLRDIVTPLCKHWYQETLIRKYPSEFTKWDFYHEIGAEGVGLTKDDFYEWWFNEEEIYRDALPIHGAVEFVERINSKYRLVALTSQPTWAAQTATIDFLNEHFAELFEAIVFTKDKSIIPVYIFIDDYVENLRTAQADFPILFHQPWNRHEDWPEVLTLPGWQSLLNIQPSGVFF